MNLILTASWYLIIASQICDRHYRFTMDNGHLHKQSKQAVYKQSTRFHDHIKAQGVNNRRNMGKFQEILFSLPLAIQEKLAS